MNMITPKPAGDGTRGILGNKFMFNGFWDSGWKEKSMDNENLEKYLSFLEQAL